MKKMQWCLWGKFKKI